MKGQSTSGTGFSAEKFFKSFAGILKPYLADAKISSKAISDPDYQVPLDRHCFLMEMVAARSNDPNLGLKLGTQYHPSDMGVLGHALLNAPDVGALLDNFVRYLSVYSRGCLMKLEIDGNQATFIYEYDITYPGPLGRVQEAECTLAMVKHAVEVAIDDRWELERVQFEHGKPESARFHFTTFGVPAEFGCSRNALSFGRAWLARKNPNAESRLHEALEYYLSENVAGREVDNDIVAQVGKLVARRLSSGTPLIDDIADELCITRRTLQRKLAAKDVTYGSYLEDIRRRLAFGYFKSREISVSEVAFLLGYSQVSTFSRAFHRWSGRSPQQFISEMRNASAEDDVPP